MREIQTNQFDWCNSSFLFHFKAADRRMENLIRARWKEKTDNFRQQQESRREFDGEKYKR